MAKKLKKNWNFSTSNWKEKDNETEKDTDNTREKEAKI